MGFGNFINSWLKDIVMLFIFISIVDLIMAKGSMKRYIDFVIGLLVIFTVINPFLKLTKINFSLDKVVMKYMDNSFITSAEKIDSEVDHDIENLFISKLSNEISRLVQENSNYTVRKIDMDIKSGENFGEIKYLDIIISDKNIESQNFKQNKINIKKIDSISVGKEVKDRSIENTADNYENIKQILYEKLNIDKGLIAIKLEDEGE